MWVAAQSLSPFGFTWIISVSLVADQAAGQSSSVSVITALTNIRTLSRWN